MSVYALRALKFYIIMDMTIAVNADVAAAAEVPPRTVTCTVYYKRYWLAEISYDPRVSAAALNVFVFTGYERGG